MRLPLQSRLLREIRYIDAHFPPADTDATDATSPEPSAAAAARPPRVYASEVVVTTAVSETDLEDVRDPERPPAAVRIGTTQHWFACGERGDNAARRRTPAARGRGSASDAQFRHGP